MPITPYHGDRAPRYATLPAGCRRDRRGLLHGVPRPPASLAFENHYLACPRCASVVASTDEYVRSIRRALERLRMEEKDGGRRSRLTHRLVKPPTAGPEDRVVTN